MKYEQCNNLNTYWMQSHNKFEKCSWETYAETN
jgi:hypothetical protein